MSIEVQRNYLEIKNPRDLLEGKKPKSECEVKIVEPINFRINKFFYKQIGKNHKWLDRLTWNDKKWNEYLNNKNVKTYTLLNKNEMIGYFEQIYDYSDCEIAYFGILEDYFGKKFGGYLLEEAIKISFKNGALRVWLHTCSLDHKNALQNYISRGMKIFKSEKIIIN